LASVTADIETSLRPVVVERMVALDLGGGEVECCYGKKPCAVAGPASFQFVK